MDPPSRRRFPLRLPSVEADVPSQRRMRVQNGDYKSIRFILTTPGTVKTEQRKTGENGVGTSETCDVPVAFLSSIRSTKPEFNLAREGSFFFSSTGVGGDGEMVCRAE